MVPPDPDTSAHASPRLSVVIPTRNRRESVRRALAALSQQTLPAEAFEVIVCVDGSDDGTIELVRSMDVPYALRGLTQQPKGRAAACNLGILASRGEIILLLDDDMEPAPTLLFAHFAAHEPGRRVAVLGPVPVVFDGSSPSVVQYVGRKFDRHLKKLARGDTITYRDFYSGNCSVRRAVLMEANLFDEQFQVYGNEDGELARRLLKFDVTFVYNTAAVARQHYEKDFRTLARDKLAQGQTAVLFARKHPDAWEKLALSTYRHGPRMQRLCRGLLLAFGCRYSRLPDHVIAAVNLVERRSRTRNLDALYRVVLDYFYWVGVQSTGTGGRWLSSSFNIFKSTKHR